MAVTDIAFTCYPVTDLKRACTFYEEILGLARSRMFGTEETGFVEYDIGPGTLAITNFSATEWKPSAGGGTVGLEVDDFDATVRHLQSRGCAFRLDPFETEICHMAVISDPDGNSITIHCRK
ncbi:MAG: VOC family protein [Nitrospira sp.]|nr:VOC family protein [Nitrospira sp.]